MAEIGRRESEEERLHSRHVSRRDFWLEIAVIVLIGMEIVLGINSGTDEDRMMNKQTAVIQTLSDNASVTAESQKATARTLQALQSTTESMNAAMQGQLALFYDVSPN